jgi:predicted permease
MASLRRLFRRFILLFRSNRADAEFTRELASHLSLLEDEYRRRGRSVDEARRAARLALGGIDQTREGHQDARSFRRLADAWRDLRYAVRMLRRNSVVAVTAVLSLAVGIGANTATFTVANALLFRGPAGVAEAARLVDIGVSRRDGGFNPTSFPTYRDIEDRAQSFDGVYAHEMFPQALSLRTGPTAGTPDRVQGDFVTRNYFEVLRVRPAIGRLFSSADREAIDASPVVVVSYPYWASRLNRDEAIIGRTLQVNGQPFTVVGIAPEGFHGTGLEAPDVWIPLNMVAAVTGQADTVFTNRDTGWLGIGARLKAGVPADAAASEIRGIGQALARDYPSLGAVSGLRLLPSSLVPGNRGALAVFSALLMGMVSLVLLVACANVSGILLARGVARRQEIAVRLSLGADRARLVRQLLTEAAVLVLLGGSTGLLFTLGLTSLFRTWIASFPFAVALPLAVDGRVAAFTAGISLLAAFAVGILPAVRMSSVPPMAAMKADLVGPRTRSRLRQMLVVGQVALSVALVAAAGLFARALARAGAIDPGFELRGVELTTLDVSVAGYTAATGLAFWNRLFDSLRVLPGVEDATLARVVPGGFEGLGFGFRVPGASRFNDGFQPTGNIVEPGYFSTLRIPFVAGRDFTFADGATTQPVVIVGEAAARHFWPGQSALGKYLLQQRIGKADGVLLVVGVVRDIKSTSLIDGMSQAFMYLPLQQAYQPIMTIVTRTSPGDSVASDVRRLVSSTDTKLPIPTSSTLEDSVALGLVPQRIAASMAGSLGTVGLVLAAVGLYALTAYTIGQRRREFGIRLALGAEPGHLLRMVLRQGFGLVLIGCAIGAVLAAAAARVLSGFLLGLSALDLPAFAGAVALCLAVGLAACYGPARRATKADPLLALRSD